MSSRVSSPRNNPVRNVANDAVNDIDDIANGKTPRRGAWNLLIIVIILVVILMVVFYILQPTFVLARNSDGSVVVPFQTSFWKNFGLSLVITLLIVLGMWVFKKVIYH